MCSESAVIKLPKTPHINTLILLIMQIIYAVILGIANNYGLNTKVQSVILALCIVLQ